MKIISGKVNSPWKVCLYGVQGLGKSTIGAAAPNALMFDLEKGLDRIDAAKTPYITKWETGNENNPGLLDALTFMANSDFDTAVFDTAEGLERIIVQKILEESGHESLADFGYGKGYELLKVEFEKLLDLLDRLVAKGKNVLILAHDEIEKFESPTDDSYDRYKIRLHKRILGPLVDRMDAVLFARYDTFLKAKGEKDFNGNDKKRAIGEGKRAIYCEERPAWIAKNRFNLGAKIEYPALDNLGSIYNLFK